ncbi:hypothetical protein F5Y10DRAFT_20041 [Nemania abortiva]|nr:hypothetical protein F5Y10DRAFT_20041 [Nemania abortiva]
MLQHSLHRMLPLSPQPNLIAWHVVPTTLFAIQFASVTSPILIGRQKYTMLRKGLLKHLSTYYVLYTQTVSLFQERMAASSAPAIRIVNTTATYQMIHEDLNTANSEHRSLSVMHCPCRSRLTGMKSHKSWGREGFMALEDSFGLGFDLAFATLGISKEICHSWIEGIVRWVICPNLMHKRRKKA